MEHKDIYLRSNKCVPAGKADTAKSELSRLFMPIECTTLEFVALS